MLGPTSGGLLGQSEKTFHGRPGTRGVQRLERTLGLGNLSNKQEQKANEQPGVDRTLGHELDSFDMTTATNWIVRPAIVLNK
jgi:hypothetical protein